MWKLKNLQNSLGNVFGKYSEAEVLVREATNEEPWGPTGEQIQKLEMLCYNEPEFSQIMNMLWYRITTDPTKSWRRVYKCLKIIENLMKNGPVLVIDVCKDNLMYLDRIKRLKYIDEEGKDCTNNIVSKSTEISLLLNDFPRLREERKSARELRAKIFSGGISSTPYHHTSDTSLALKTRGVVNNIIGKLGVNTEKSFYESGNSKMINSYAYMYGSGKGGFTDDVDEDEEIKKNLATEIPLSTNRYSQNKTLSSNDEFGEFVGESQDSSKLNPQLTNKQLEKNNELLNIFENSNFSHNSNTVSNNNLDIFNNPSISQASSNYHASNALNQNYQLGVQQQYINQSVPSTQISSPPFMSDQSTKQLPFVSGQTPNHQQFNNWNPNPSYGNSHNTSSFDISSSNNTYFSPRFNSTQQYMNQPSQQYMNQPNQQYMNQPSQQYMNQPNQQYMNQPNQQYMNQPNQVNNQDHSVQYQNNTNIRSNKTEISKNRNSNLVSKNASMDELIKRNIENFL